MLRAESFSPSLHAVIDIAIFTPHSEAQTHQSVRLKGSLQISNQFGWRPPSKTPSPSLHCTPHPRRCGLSLHPTRLWMFLAEQGSAHVMCFGITGWEPAFFEPSLSRATMHMRSGKTDEYDAPETTGDASMCQKRHFMEYAVSIKLCDLWRVSTKFYMLIGMRVRPSKPSVEARGHVQSHAYFLDISRCK